MSGIFINHTNHSVVSWCEEQINKAKEYGEVIDIPFPAIDPKSDTNDVIELVKEYFKNISNKKPSAVLIQGEFVYVYYMVKFLKEAGITALAASSERNVKESVDEEGNSIKTSVFSFVRFREY